MNYSLPRGKHPDNEVHYGCENNLEKPWQILGVYNPGHVRVACVQIAHHAAGGRHPGGSRGRATGAQLGAT